MNSQILKPATIIAAIFVLSGVASADVPANVAQVVYVPANSSPPVPAGLKVTCMDSPNTLQSAATCPVVKYQGMTTWAYSYIDNRVSFGLVTYDATNNVVRNIEKPGARYIWNMVSSEKTQQITLAGQANQTVEINWSDVGP
jgi:hypothetical protein